MTAAGPPPQITSRRGRFGLSKVLDEMYWDMAAFRFFDGSSLGGSGYKVGNRAIPA
jgi:hypothetical protein